MPSVNKYHSVCRTPRKEGGRIEDRLLDLADKQAEKLKKMKRDLTPTFKPRINKNTKSYKELSAVKSKAYDSVRADSSTHKFNSNNFNYMSRGTKDYQTKGETEASFSSLPFGIKPKPFEDDFRNMLESYEQNLNKAIIIEEESNGYPTELYELQSQSQTQPQEINFLTKDSGYGEFALASIHSFRCENKRRVLPSPWWLVWAT